MVFFRQVYLTPLILNPAFVSVLCNFADIYFSFDNLTFEIFGLDKLVLYLLFQASFQFFVETATYFLILLLDRSNKLFIFLFLELLFYVHLKLLFDCTIDILVNASRAHILFHRVKFVSVLLPETISSHSLLQLDLGVLLPGLDLLSLLHFLQIALYCV